MNFVFESEGGGTEFHPIKTKCVNINFKKFFWEKINAKVTVWLSILKPLGKLPEKTKNKNKNKIGSLLFEAMIDTWTFKILIRKIINLALLFIMTWKSKDESHGIIKLLSIIILIFIQQIKFQPQKTSTKKKKNDKKLFLFKTINLSCEEVDIKIKLLTSITNIFSVIS